MVKTVLFTFEDEVSRDKFVTKVKGLASKSIEVSNALKNLRLDPHIKTDAERTVCLFVSGKKLYEGLLPYIQMRFSEETAAHSASVEIREFQGGIWKTIRSRKQQK